MTKETASNLTFQNHILYLVGSIRGKAEVILEMTPKIPTRTGERLMWPRADIGSQKSAKFFNVSVIKGIEGDDLDPSSQWSRMSKLNIKQCMVHFSLPTLNKRDYSAL